MCLAQEEEDPRTPLLTSSQWFDRHVVPIAIIVVIAALVGVSIGRYVVPLAYAHDPPRPPQLPRREYYTHAGVLKVENMVLIHAWDKDGQYAPTQYIVSDMWCRRFMLPGDPKSYIKVGDWVRHSDWQLVTKYPDLVEVLGVADKIRLEEGPGQIRVVDEDY